jgi:hypothetical protein
MSNHVACNKFAEQKGDRESRDETASEYSTFLGIIVRKSPNLLLTLWYYEIGNSSVPESCNMSEGSVAPDLAAIYPRKIVVQGVYRFTDCGVVSIRKVPKFELNRSWLHLVRRDVSVPTGLRCERRPADVSGCAFIVPNISIGEADDVSARPIGRVRSGTNARAPSTTPEERAAIARQGAAARWSKRA